MSEPGAFLPLEAFLPTPSAKVEMRETHISRVFLAAEDVYKLKKPVNLGFLDYRSLEQRKEACEAELRLNGRLAPEVYLGVVPITRRGDSQREIAGSGEVVDWAVHMRRLPDEDRADVRLQRGDLMPEQIDQIASHIARFHGSAVANEETARFGAPEVIAHNLEENFLQSADTLAAYVDREQAREIVSFQKEFLREHESRFLRRVSGGRIRDGHGDLRLEHVYFVGRDNPTIIDCIEFNDRFRFGDVCADIAFLSMDLAAKGRVDYAERLLAAYARESNDFDLYGLVDFYESYRALIRAKISALLAADGEVSASERARAAADARHYLLLALSANRRALAAPVLVAVGGLIGSGKSTWAERLGAEMGAPVIVADRVRKARMGREPTERVHAPPFQGPYDPEATKQVYEELLRLAEVVLCSGRSVILDASFRSRRMRSMARALARRAGVPFFVVECTVETSIAVQRLRERQETANISDGRLSIFEAFRRAFEPMTELAPTEHIQLDTSRPPDESWQQLRSLLGASTERGPLSSSP